MTITPVELLKTLFDAAVEAAQPAHCLPRYLPEYPKGRTIVIGAGKASAAMAQVLESHWQGEIEGLVVTRYGHAVPCQKIGIIEAAHPVPDQASEVAAQRILKLVQNLTADDLVICLISGGASSLLSLPAPGISLKDKQRVHSALLNSGATIADMNVVRKHLSSIKGGQLAEAVSPARLVTLLISDVPGDDISVIGSGPTVADPSTFADALDIIARYAIDIPDTVSTYLHVGLRETPKNDHPCFRNAETHIIAAPQTSLMAAADMAMKQGYQFVVLGDSLEGEAKEVALVHAGIVKQILRHGQPVTLPCVLLSGGETTVSVRGKGRGGRNAEFGLAFAKAMNGAAGVYGIFCDTDGIDGTENNAGVMVTPDTLSLAQAQGMNLNDYLADNDAFSFFSALDALVVTGPTLTNVNDFRAIVITAATS